MLWHNQSNSGFEDWLFPSIDVSNRKSLMEDVAILSIFFDYSPLLKGMADPLKPKFDCLCQSRSNDPSKNPVIPIKKVRNWKNFRIWSSSPFFSISHYFDGDVYISVFPYLIRNDVRARSWQEAHSICFQLRAIELKLRNSGLRINWDEKLENFSRMKMSPFLQSFSIFRQNWCEGPGFGSLSLTPFHKGSRFHVAKPWPLASILTKNWKRLEEWWHLHSRKVFQFFISIDAKAGVSKL